MDKRTAIIEWYERTWTARARAALDGTARIDWIEPGTRVTWTELLAEAERLGEVAHAVDLRNWWHSVRDWEKWQKRTAKSLANEAGR